jgi:type VI secretion system secreted protein VgrG
VRRKIDQGFVGKGTGEREDERRNTVTRAALTPVNEFVAIRNDVVYRPKRVTPRPTIAGVLYATVDGPNLGLPAPIDSLGQYKVVLPFDVAAEGGGKCSRWIRMAQPMSGPNYGVQFPLHEGAEVLLAHVEGDPDRPIIVGSPPNTLNVAPVTSANPTKSIMRTLSGITVEFQDDTGTDK